jgi:serine/threonine-protein kinase
MGEVFAGVDETLQRRVALKAIRADHRLRADARARFLREARLLSQLDHPHICRVYDYVEGFDTDWLVMELIEGKTLRTALDSNLDHATKLRIAEQIADVLVATHAEGIVHRDLKPGNIMLTGNAVVKVLDFGIASSARVRGPAAEPAPAGLVESPPAAVASDLDLTSNIVAEAPTMGSSGATLSQTAPGAMVGTLGYMSPEQAAGDVATPASDMYSFGLLIQELFTEKKPFDTSGDRETVVNRALKGETVPVAGLDADITSLIARLKSFAPPQRPPAVEVAERLRWIRQKPRRRLIRAGIAAAVLLIVLGVAKYTIDLARERTVAVAAREDADRRRQQAESLIGFMLGDLRTRLQEVGRLELLDSVGREATAYFNAIPPESLSGEELYRRSQSMYQIGQIRQAEGKLPEATRAYADAIRFGEQAVARDPKSGEWQLGLATAHFYAGDALRRQGDLDGAAREFTAYRDTAQRLAVSDPKNAKWQLEVAYGYSNVAAIHELRGDLEPARSALESSQTILDTLFKRDPQDGELAEAVANNHNRLGVVLDKMGRGDEALPHLLADVDLRRRALEKSPQSSSVQHGYGIALSYAGLFYEARGNLDAAHEYFRQFVDVATRLSAQDSRNMAWKRDAAVARINLADVLWLQGGLQEAQRNYEEALAGLRSMGAASSALVAWQLAVVRGEIGLAHVDLQRNAADAAQKHLDEAERIVGPLVERSTSRDARKWTAEARLASADVSDRRRERAEAIRLRESVLTLLGAGGAPADKETLALQARALLGLGRTAEAQPAVARLLAQEYRHPSLMKLIVQGSR